MHLLFDRPGQPLHGRPFRRWTGKIIQADAQGGKSHLHPTPEGRMVLVDDAPHQKGHDPVGLIPEDIQGDPGGTCLDGSKAVFPLGSAFRCNIQGTVPEQVHAAALERIGIVQRLASGVLGALDRDTIKGVEKPVGKPPLEQAGIGQKKDGTFQPRHDQERIDQGIGMIGQDDHRSLRFGILQSLHRFDPIIDPKGQLDQSIQTIIYQCQERMHGQSGQDSKASKKSFII